MAGVTDQPFRLLCRRLGAGLVVSEMVTSDQRLWNTRKSRQRLNHSGECEPRSVQIAGNDPQMMAQAARESVRLGAQIVDINMGCPAKKVCNKAAGSALLRDEPLVRDILQAVVEAVSVPVTVKIRTGWSPEQRNGVTIARIAEDCGIRAIAVHGRTRACAYKGAVEYDTIARIKQAVAIPVIANGDINSPADARAVIDYTGADGVMIGRGAHGRPWIFREINHYLRTGSTLCTIDLHEFQSILLEHLSSIHAFYGEYLGVRIARKHVAWYTNTQPGGSAFRREFVQLESAQAQCASAQQFCERLINNEDIAA
ncbi:tRNA dihydrouridine synthase DusB [Aestuariirhabdus litorea]